jgi:hypothetical protein
MPEIDDPRTFPDPKAAPAESARMHALAAASQAASGRAAAVLDRELEDALAAMLLPGQGGRLAATFATAPSVAIYRHLWRLLVQCERSGQSADTLGVTLFALPIVIVAGIEGDRHAQVSLSGVLGDVPALAAILREHRALAGNQSFALANVLAAQAAIDLAQLPDLLTWRDVGEASDSPLALQALPIKLLPGPETVHLRFVVGRAVAAPMADLLRDDAVGKWGIPFAQALARELTVPGTAALALPRAPQSLLRAMQQGRAAQRDVGAGLFASNAIRKLRASVGEPTAVISAHRAPDASGGGELRLSLSSPFDPREAEGFRCPLFPLDRVRDVASMLLDLLAECRVADVRVAPGVHGDRDPLTGLPLLFKGDEVQALLVALH